MGLITIIMLIGLLFSIVATIGFGLYVYCINEEIKAMEEADEKR